MVQSQLAQMLDKDCQPLDEAKTEEPSFYSASTLRLGLRGRRGVRLHVCVLLNNRLASQQNQKAERLMWSDKATGLGIAAGCDTSWISSPERLIQERRLTQGVQGSLLQPDTRVEIIMYMCDSR